MPIEDFKFASEKLPPVDLDKLRERTNYSVGSKLPQPDEYLFTLPTKIELEEIASVAGGRVVLKFQKKNYLKCHLNGGGTAPLWLNLNNEERVFGGDTINDLALLLAALGYEGVITTNSQYISALQESGGKQFVADLVWTAKNRKTGKKFQAPRGYKTKDGKTVHTVPRGSSGSFQENFDDDGENVRCFPSIRNFRKVNKIENV